MSALEIVQLEVGLLQNFCEVIACPRSGHTPAPCLVQRIVRRPGDSAAQGVTILPEREGNGAMPQQLSAVADTWAAPRPEAPRSKARASVLGREQEPPTRMATPNAQAIAVR